MTTSRPIARLGDSTYGVCVCHKHPRVVSGTIITASPNTLANGRGVARLGDTVMASCGHTATIVTASPKNLANGMPIARLGDSFTGCYSGTIVTASPNNLA